MIADPNRLLSTIDAAELLGLQPCTLAAWREDGSQPGLAFFKLGKAVRYRYGDLIAFIETRRASSTLLARQLPASRSPAATVTPVADEVPVRRKARKAARGADGQQTLF